MKEQKIVIEFTLKGEIKKDLFIQNLGAWIDNANDQMLDPANIPDVDRIDWHERLGVED